MKSLTGQDLEDLIRGCAILGTGGGGSPQEGLRALREELENGYEFKLISLDETPDDAMLASPYMCGSVNPEDSNEGKPTSKGIECLWAFEALEEYLGQNFYAAIPTEIGGGNTAVAMVAAARRGIPIVDADPAGRSVPELQHTTFYTRDIPIGPLAVATAMKDTLIITNVADDGRAEAIVRAIAVASNNSAGVADHPITGQRLKSAIVAGSVSRALAIGKAVREARSIGEDPVNAALVAGQGYFLFAGKVNKATWKIEEGFTIGELDVSGSSDYSSHNYRIWYKNEHIISWLDGKTDVTVPDLICVLDPRTGEAITNPNCKQGMDVAVIGYSSPEIWRTRSGLEAFGPGHFGYDIPYQPLEQNNRLNKQDGVR